MSVDIALNEEIARGASRFLASRLPIRPTGPFPSAEDLKAVWKELLELGWPYVLATEHGSTAGASQVETIFRVLGRHPITGPTVDMFVALPLVWRAASADVQQLLEPFLTGSRLLSLARVSERPDQSVDSDVWAGCAFSEGQLSGSKTLVDSVDLADSFLVLAHEDGNPVILLVDKDAAGVRGEPLSTPDLSRQLGLVHFENAPAAPLLSGERAREVVDAIEALARLAIVAELAGLADAALTMTVDYAKLRKQFGRPIGSFQAIKQLLAEAKMFEYSLSCVSLRLAEELEEQSEDDGGTLNSVRALCYATRTSQSVFDIALQVHGGIGFTLEYALSWYYNRAAGLWGLWGDPNQLALELGARLGRQKNRA